MSFAELPQISPEASLGRRFLALAIDWTMCRLITALVSPNLFLDSSFSTLIIFFIEVTLFTTLLQASAGQRIMAIKVVTYPEQLRVAPQKVFFAHFTYLLSTTCSLYKRWQGISRSLYAKPNYKS